MKGWVLLTARSGLKLGFTYALAVALTMAVFLFTFTTHESLCIAGVFETFLANYTLAGLLAGFLNQKFALASERRSAGSERSS